MGDGNKGGPPVVRFSSSVGPENAANVTMHYPNLYPQLPMEDYDLKTNANNGAPVPGKSPSFPRRLAQLSNIPRVNLANLPSLPREMMNIGEYIPHMNPLPFLKEVYTLPVQVGDHVNREVRNFGNNINKLIDKSEVYLHKPPPLPEFTNYSILSTLYSIAGALFDHGSDIAAAYVLWYEPDSKWWFWLTAALIVIPLIFVNAFSLYWYCNKEHQAARHMFSSRPGFSKCWWAFRIMVHILLLGPIIRYFDLLYYGLKSRKSRLQRVNIQGPYCPWPKKKDELKKQVDYYNLLLVEERDISILELMQSFMQDAPQLILQLYILAKRPPVMKTDHDYIITVLVQSISSLTSLVSMAWSLTSYQRILRYATPDKPQMSVGGSASIFLWHTFQVASRVLALALFANAFKLEVFILLGAHWSLMTLWVLAQRTNFCGTADGKRKPCEEFFYNVVVGWVFTFVMVNVKNAATRVKYIVYYAVMAGENAAMIALWFLDPASAAHWYHLPALIGTCASFFLGLVFMAVYYRHYHPDGKMPNKAERGKLI